MARRRVGGAIATAALAVVLAAVAIGAFVHPAPAFAAKERATTVVTGMVFSQSSVYCTGREAYPTVTVLSGTRRVASSLADSNQRVTVSGLRGNVLPGTYNVTVNGVGSCMGRAMGSYQIKVMPTYVSGLRAVAGGFAATVKAKAGRYVSSYQVRYSTKKSMAGAKTVSVSKAKAAKTVRGLKSGKRYYVQARVIKRVDGVRYASAWSRAKSVVAR
ncbi:MAG: hypothetical protein Q4D06_06075 [Coriobacteriia bacterium]|nr:hypothetical protein [Coriobacteriia bacterium]